MFESSLLNVTLRDYCQSHDRSGWALDAWERRLVRGLKQVKTPYHLREHRLFLWPEKANGAEALSEEVEGLQPEINACKQQLEDQGIAICVSIPSKWLQVFAMTKARHCMRMT